MIRNALTIPDEYTTALSEHLKFDLSPQSIATRPGKAYIAQMAEIVSRISFGLTTSREEFLASGYLRQSEIRKAYALYYMTTNLLKISQPLLELSCSNFFENPHLLRCLDLGTGTGAAAWGAISSLNLKENSRPQFTLTDSIEENLNEAEAFSRHFLTKFPLIPKPDFEKFDLRRPENIPEKVKNQEPFDLITMMNVLNELDEEKDELLYKAIASLLHHHGAVIMIEPATRSQSRRLLRFRNLAISHGATIYSPCTRQKDCPALIKEDDWCHTDIPWIRPPFIKAIDDIVGTLRLSLKSTYLILRKDGATLGNALQQENLYRIVSERFDEKGRVRAILCGENGRNEHIINKRDISEFNKEFSEIQRYDVAQVKDEEVRGHDIKLLKRSKFSIVLPILGAR